MKSNDSSANCSRRALSTVCDVRVRDVAEAFARQANHFVRNIHAVNFAEVTAQRLHQAAGAAADFERPPAGGARCFETLQLSLDQPQHIGRGRQKRFFVLIAAAERDVIVGVLARALVPVLAHAFGDVQSVGHSSEQLVVLNGIFGKLDAGRSLDAARFSFSSR